jgi:hypothetical protein
MADVDEPALPMSEPIQMPPEAPALRMEPPPAPGAAGGYPVRR